ncbi:MAG: hypothetical protein LBH18_04495 [Spirochaetaceae bacterium]|jgi:hypothetical protein|nr:hypothetical protein [Spirochaetaceae bacterium]
MWQNVKSLIAFFCITIYIAAAAFAVVRIYKAIGEQHFESRQEFADLKDFAARASASGVLSGEYIEDIKTQLDMSKAIDAVIIYGPGGSKAAFEKKPGLISYQSGRPDFNRQIKLYRAPQTAPFGTEGGQSVNISAFSPLVNFNTLLLALRSSFVAILVALIIAFFTLIVDVSLEKTELSSAKKNVSRFTNDNRSEPEMERGALPTSGESPDGENSPQTDTEAARFEETQAPVEPEAAQTEEIPSLAGPEAAPIEEMSSPVEQGIVQVEEIGYSTEPETVQSEEISLLIDPEIDQTEKISYSTEPETIQSEEISSLIDPEIDQTEEIHYSAESESDLIEETPPPDELETAQVEETSSSTDPETDQTEEIYYSDEQEIAQTEEGLSPTGFEDAQIEESLPIAEQENEGLLAAANAMYETDNFGIMDDDRTFIDDLKHELRKAEHDGIDLSLLCIEWSAAGLQEEVLVKQAAAFFKNGCRVFEREGGVYIIMPGVELDDVFADAKEFHRRARELMPQNVYVELLMGISARSGRSVSAMNLLNEAERALDKARADSALPIVAFKADPQKYREFARRQKKLF